MSDDTNNTDKSVAQTDEALTPKITHYLKVGGVVLIGSLFVYYFLKGWGVTCINVWNNQALPMRLPTMLILAFLAGFLPMYGWHAMKEWRWENKMLKLQNQMAKIAPRSK